MEEVKLIGAWPSPYVYRIIWALELKGIKYEYVQEDLANKSDLLVRYNPVYEKVPVLVHGGKSIVESTVILEYIEETWPHNSLIPKDPYEKAMNRFWTVFGEEKSLPFAMFYVTVGEEQENAAKEVREILRILEEEGLHQGKKFFSGNQIGIADINFGWIAMSFEIIEEVVGVQVLDRNEFPRLLAWVQRFRENPVIKANLPNHEKMFNYYETKRKMILASQMT